MENYSTTLRNNQLAQIEATIGTSPTFEVFDGTKPAACSDADAGTALAIITLPSDYLTAPSGGSMSKNGTWSGTASGDGTAQYYHIKSSGGTVHIQGTVGESGSGADAIIDNASVNTGQTVTITAYSKTAGNA